MKRKLYLISGFLGLIAFTVGLGLKLSGEPQDEMVTVPVNEPAPAVPSPARPKGQEIFPEMHGQNGKIDEREFRDLAATVQDKLSDGENRRAENHDHHLAGTETFDAAAEVAKIEDALDANPSLYSEAAKFYSDCAHNEGAVFSIRAVCLAKLRIRSRQVGRPADYNPSDFGANLVEIAEQL